MYRCLPLDVRGQLQPRKAARIVKTRVLADAVTPTITNTINATVSNGVAIGHFALFTPRHLGGFLIGGMQGDNLSRVDHLIMMDLPINRCRTKVAMRLKRNGGDKRRPLGVAIGRNGSRWRIISPPLHSPPIQHLTPAASVQFVSFSSSPPAHVMTQSTHPQCLRSQTGPALAQPGAPWLSTMSVRSTCHSLGHATRSSVP